jgi:hypothetical protein
MTATKQSFCVVVTQLTAEQLNIIRTRYQIRNLNSEMTSKKKSTWLAKILACTVCKVTHLQLMKT